jgi:hypothetical protein
MSGVIKRRVCPMTGASAAGRVRRVRFRDAHGEVVRHSGEGLERREAQGQREAQAERIATANAPGMPLACLPDTNGCTEEQMRTLILIVGAAIVSACASPAGGLKPSVVTVPTGYLENFPLGLVTENEMISESGPPDRTADIGGKKAYVYELGEGYGKRTYTYIVDNGVIADVLYNDQGPYNGITARSRQQLK